MGVTEGDDVKVNINENECETQLMDKLMASNKSNGTADQNNNDRRCVQLKIEVLPDSSSKGLRIFGYRPSEIKWTNVIWLLFIHTLAVIGYVYVSLYPVKFWSVWWTIFLGLLGGFGVSVGAHRLWAHRSYKARWLLRFVLVLIEGLSMNGGCYSYARDHRCHHKCKFTIRFL